MPTSKRCFYGTTQLDHWIEEPHVFPSKQARDEWIEDTIPESEEWYCEIGPREELTAAAAKSRMELYSSVIIHNYKRLLTADWVANLVSPMPEQPHTDDHMWDLCYFSK